MRKIVYMWPNIDIYATKLFWKIMRVLVFMYYTDSGYRTSVFGKKNHAYYIRIFMVSKDLLQICS